jgi:hypothetical protein
MTGNIRIRTLLKQDRPLIRHLVRGWHQVLETEHKPPRKKGKAKSSTAARAASRSFEHLGRDEKMAFLRKSLQAAVTLEFATIPPYLCALWSIKDELDESAKLIRAIVQEEMLHMALACNMLAAIGGEPKIIDPGFIPKFPTRLPGGVHPNLVVRLSGLNNEALKSFLHIERPSVFPTNIETDKADRVKPERSIGDFYMCILRAFQELEPEITTGRQITGPLSWIVIRGLDDVETAIELIKSQGEGAANGELSPRKKYYPHYYNFKSIYRRQELKWDSQKKMHSYGRELKFPDVWPMADVPKGGYLAKNVAPDVWYLLDRFDMAYSELLRLLQQAWTRGGQAALVRGIDKMFELQKYAKPLMQIPIRSKASRRIRPTLQTYGPCFRYKPE